MNDLIDIDAVPKMSSVEIADLCEKRHAHVVRDIRNMLKELEITVSKFGHRETYGKNNDREVFRLPKDLTITLVAGYSIKLRKRIIDRWLELEEFENRETQKIDLTNPEQLISIIHQTAEHLQIANKKIQVDKPKVEFYDQFISKDGLYGLQNAARALHQMPNKFVQRLKEEYLFYQGGSLVAKARYIQMGIFEIITTVVDDKIRPRTFITPKGLQYFAKKLDTEPVA